MCSPTSQQTKGIHFYRRFSFSNSSSGIEDNLQSQEVHKKIEALEISGGIGGGNGGGGGIGRSRTAGRRDKDEVGDFEREKGEMEEEQRKASNAEKSATGGDKGSGVGGVGSGVVTPLSPGKDERLKPWREENGEYFR